MSISFQLVALCTLVCLCDGGRITRLPRQFRAKWNDPRPTMDFIPDDIKENFTASAPNAACGSNNDIYNGDRVDVRATSE